MIDRFAIVEAKALIRQHTQLIFQWAEQHKGRYVTADNKEDLKTLCASIYELADAMPEGPVGHTRDPETGEKVALNG